MSELLKESLLKEESAAYSKKVEAGDYWYGLVPKGSVFRIVDLEGNQAADTMFYCYPDFSDRYDAQETILRQQNVYLSTGTVLYSREGKAMLEIVADTCGRHDTLGGACAAESNCVRYPLEKIHMHNCRDSFVNALKSANEDSKLKLSGVMSKRDLNSNINFFMNVPVSPDGGSAFSDGISDAGKYVELKALEDVLAVISNCPQLNNPCNAYNPTAVKVLIWGENG